MHFGKIYSNKKAISSIKPSNNKNLERVSIIYDKVNVKFMKSMNKYKMVFTHNIQAPLKSQLKSPSNSGLFSRK